MQQMPEEAHTETTHRLHVNRLLLTEAVTVSLDTSSVFTCACHLMCTVATRNLAIAIRSLKSCTQYKTMASLVTL